MNAGLPLSETIVATEGLSKTFSTPGRQVHAVRDLTLSVRQGELFGLFGPNGAGKTTLIRMLSTLLAPTDGTATVNGFSITSEALRVRSSIGLVASDERSFYGRLTAWQNLAFYAALQNVNRGQIRDRSKTVLDMFGLLPKADASFQSLSTGQKQRLNMARALVHDPSILFLDEPTKSMDIQTSDFVRALIKEDLVAKRGKTVIFISHDLHEMDDFCDRVAILAGGRLQAVGTPDELAELIPRRAIYRVKAAGNAAAIAASWLALPTVEAVTEVSSGVKLTTFDIALADEAAEVLAGLVEAAVACGGRLEAYQRVDDGSLRDIIKHYSIHTDGE